MLEKRSFLEKHVWVKRFWKTYLGEKSVLEKTILEKTILEKRFGINQLAQAKDQMF